MRFSPSSALSPTTSAPPAAVTIRRSLLQSPLLATAAPRRSTPFQSAAIAFTSSTSTSSPVPILFPSPLVAHYGYFIYSLSYSATSAASTMPNNWVAASTIPQRTVFPTSFVLTQSIIALFFHHIFFHPDLVCLTYTTSLFVHISSVQLSAIVFTISSALMNSFLCGCYLNLYLVAANFG